MPKQYRLPGSSLGLVRGGNIDILARARLRVANPKGGYSSVYSTSFTLPRGTPNAGKEVLIPQVVHRQNRWQVVGPKQAYDYYRATGKNLGVFQNPAAANRYAERLHRQQARGG